jgi:hypothetical protein
VGCDVGVLGGGDGGFLAEVILMRAEKAWMLPPGYAILLCRYFEHVNHGLSGR